MPTRRSSVVAVTAISVLGTFAVASGQDSSGNASLKDEATLTPSGDSIALDIDSGRPVLRGILTFEQKYGYVITYEDPSYVYSLDTLDATSQVRRDHRTAGPGVPKIRLPRASKLSIQIPASPCITPSQMGSLLFQLVSLQQASSSGGHYRTEQSKSGSIFHVIPTEVRGPNGDWSQQASPLDTRISFPAQPRTERQLLAAIAHAVSAAAHVRMSANVNGGIVMQIGPPQPYYFNIGANNEVAREVLTKMLDARPQTRQSWALMNAVEEGPNIYFLDVMDMPPSPACQSSNPPPPPPGSQPGCISCGPPASPPSSVN